MEQTTLGKRQVRSAPANFITRDEGGNQYIEGMFAVFGAIYEIAPGLTESIAPGAFAEAINGDVRCLTDHDTRLVLGRTTAGTFELRETEEGLWGRALINPKDQDAVNTKARVDRKDVTQASFGFDILDEAAEKREDGSVHWTIKKVKLYECSVCTFPAYKETNILARKQDLETIRMRSLQAWRAERLKRLEGIKNGTESTDAQEKD